MGLSCKPGFYMEVFMKLLRKYIDQRDIFLLFSLKTIYYKIGFSILLGFDNVV